MSVIFFWVKIFSPVILPRHFLANHIVLSWIQSVLFSVNINEVLWILLENRYPRELGEYGEDKSKEFLIF